MTPRKAVGPSASVRKYDLVTALGCYALGAGKHIQRLTLRLITLLTARYNWRLEELTVGRREIARLWRVDERTVKRDMAKIRALGWLVVKRPGVRGRVTTYTLDHAAIDMTTRDAWAAVGPDFEARMTGETGGAGPDGQGSNVVPMPGAAAPPKPPSLDGTEWSFAAARFAAESPAIYRAWVQPLRRKDCADGTLTLIAPSAFHRHHVQTRLADQLLSTLREIDPNLRALSIVTDQD